MDGVNSTLGDPVDGELSFGSVEVCRFLVGHGSSGLIKPVHFSDSAVGELVMSHFPLGVVLVVVGNFEVLELENFKSVSVLLDGTVGLALLDDVLHELGLDFGCGNGAGESECCE